MQIPKKIPIARIIIGIWLVVTTIYMVWGLWGDFSMYIMQRSYTAGQTDAINALILQAQDKNCKPFSVFSGKQTVDIINVACLQETTESPKTELKK